MVEYYDTSRGIYIEILYKKFQRCAEPNFTIEYLGDSKQNSKIF
jgi:hypothetical protein